MATTNTKKAPKTSEEMYPLVESWFQSGMTQHEFSLKHQLSPHVLPYWINRYRQQYGDEKPVVPSQRVLEQEPVPKEAPATFIQVLPQPAAPTPPESIPPNPEPTLSLVTSMAIELPTGVVLRFSSLIPVSYLKEVVAVCSR